MSGPQGPQGSQGQSGCVNLRSPFGTEVLVGPGEERFLFVTTVESREGTPTDRLRPCLVRPAYVGTPSQRPTTSSHPLRFQGTLYTTLGTVRVVPDIKYSIPARSSDYLNPLFIITDVSP